MLAEKNKMKIGLVDKAYFSFTCPLCKHGGYVEKDMLDAVVTCSFCGAKITNSVFKKKVEDGSYRRTTIKERLHLNISWFKSEESGQATIEYIFMLSVVMAIAISVGFVYFMLVERSIDNVRIMVNTISSESQKHVFELLEKI